MFAVIIFANDWIIVFYSEKLYMQKKSTFLNYFKKD